MKKILIMSDLEKAKEFLKSRAIICKKGNMALIQRQSEVIPIIDVVAIIEMLEDNTFNEFIKKIEEIGSEPLEKQS
jgi:hypothetical protein